MLSAITNPVKKGVWTTQEREKEKKGVYASELCNLNSPKSRIREALQYPNVTIFSLDVR